MNSEQQHESAVTPESVNFNFGPLQAEFATLIILDRMEERQRLHGKMLSAILEKLEPGSSESDAYKMDNEEGWLLRVLDRIGKEIDLVKTIESKK